MGGSARQAAARRRRPPAPRRGWQKALHAGGRDPRSPDPRSIYHPGARRDRSGARPMTEKISVTFFTDWYAGSMRCEALTLAELGGRIQHASAASKEALEWLKLARFGNRRTQKGSLRHDSNLIAITGIEIDLDKETLS